MCLTLICVRLIGLEPTRPATPDPKSGASTNFATSALCHVFACKVTLFNPIIQEWRLIYCAVLSLRAALTCHGSAFLERYGTL